MQQMERAEWVGRFVLRAARRGAACECECVAARAEALFDTSINLPPELAADSEFGKDAEHGLQDEFIHPPGVSS